MNVLKSIIFFYGKIPYNHSSWIQMNNSNDMEQWDSKKDRFPTLVNILEYSWTYKHSGILLDLLFVEKVCCKHTFREPEEQ